MRQRLLRSAKRRHFDLGQLTWTVASFPELLAEWDVERNGSLEPSSTSFRSEKVVWWKCVVDEGHRWQAPVGGRIRRVYEGEYLVRRCPLCDHRWTAPERSLATAFPELCREWDQQRNGRLKPSDVAPMSSKKVWWQCRKGHGWLSAIRHRTSAGAGCPRCAAEPEANNTLAARAPDWLDQWHPTRNGSLKPEDVSAGSGRKIWWKCSAASDHEWLACPATRRRAPGCPFCLNHRVSLSNSLAQRFPVIAGQWHPSRNGTLHPGGVIASSGREAWWKCPHGPDHEWKSAVSARTKRNAECPYCAGRLASQTNCLASLHPRIAMEWHPERNGELSPSEVVATSRANAWWKCQLNHEWRASVHSRTVLSRACPICSSFASLHEVPTGEFRQVNAERTAHL